MASSASKRNLVSISPPTSLSPPTSNHRLSALPPQDLSHAPAPCCCFLVQATLLSSTNCCGKFFLIGPPSPALSSLQTALHAELGARSQHPAMFLSLPFFQAFTCSLLLLGSWPDSETGPPGPCLLVSLIPQHAPAAPLPTTSLPVL